jgi:hypothetical protein
MGVIGRTIMGHAESQRAYIYSLTSYLFVSVLCRHGMERKCKKRNKTKFYALRPFLSLYFSLFASSSFGGVTKPGHPLVYHSGTPKRQAS